MNFRVLIIAVLCLCYQDSTAYHNYPMAGGGVRVSRIPLENGAMVHGRGPNQQSFYSVQNSNGLLPFEDVINGVGGTIRGIGGRIRNALSGIGANIGFNAGVGLGGSGLRAGIGLNAGNGFRTPNYGGFSSGIGNPSGIGFNGGMANVNFDSYGSGSPSYYDGGIRPVTTGIPNAYNLPLQDNGFNNELLGRPIAGVGSCTCTNSQSSSPYFNEGMDSGFPNGQFRGKQAGGYGEYPLSSSFDSGMYPQSFGYGAMNPNSFSNLRGNDGISMRMMDDDSMSKEASDETESTKSNGGS